MKSLLLVLGFFSYNSWLFLINDPSLLRWALVFEVGILIPLYKGLPAVLALLCKKCGFIIFVVLCNLLFSGWEQALLFGLRLILVIGATHIFIFLLSTEGFIEGITMLFMPLRLFRVDVGDLALSITIALTFVSLLLYESRQLNDSLKLKGCSWRVLFRRPQVYVIGLIERTFDCAEASEKTLRLKGYE